MKLIAFNACQVILKTNSTNLCGKYQTNSHHEYKKAFSQRTVCTLHNHCRLPSKQGSADMPHLLFILLLHESISIAMTWEDKISLRDPSEPFICSLIHSFTQIKSSLHTICTRQDARLRMSSIHKSAKFCIFFSIWSTIKNTTPLWGDCST